MPTYDYACAACGHRFEVVHGVHGQGPESCPDCGTGPVRKAFAPPTIMFKGSGWAKMDRRSNATTGTKKGSEDSSGGSTKDGGDGAGSGGDAAAAKGSTGSSDSSGSTAGSAGSSSTSSTSSTSAPD